MRGAMIIVLLTAHAAAAKPDEAARLGRAYEALRAGDFESAQTLATPLLKSSLRVRDYAIYVAAESAFLVGKRAAALPLFQQLSQLGKGRFKNLAMWRTADCLWDLGRKEAARKGYEKALTVDKEAGDHAVALDHIAEAHLAARRKDRAIATWRMLALGFPLHPLAHAAVARLGKLGTALSAREHLARAEEMTRLHGWDEALKELAVVSGETLLRDFWTGETLFKMRREYGRAGELLIGVHEKMGERAAQALFHGARALSRADHDDDAIRGYREVVKKYPHSEYAAEAQFLSGWLEFNRGNFRAGLPGLEETLRRFGASKWADDALWYAGFSHYLLGEYPLALSQFERLAGHSGALEGGKGRYWRARTLDALGKSDEATQALRELVGIYPFAWYSLLARARLAERGLLVGPFGEKERSPELAPRVASVDSALAKEDGIGRAEELIAAGLGPEAGFELERAQGGLMSRYGSSRALPILFDRYARAGNFYRPWMLAETYGGRALDLPPKGPARFWWEKAYPLAFREHVEHYRELGKNPPYYLYAIMRKESGFNPHDVSYADAIGLLQMIPPTTRRVAPQVGLEYLDDLLFQPELNIKVGSWYIGNLAHKFKLQIPIAAGSFNCGPSPVMKWLDKFGDQPIDLFVERVAYTQTREYMKKVAEGYARYLYLYEGQVYDQPLVVDKAYVQNDLTY